MYKLHDRYIDVWIGDQMNTALRKTPMFDAIVTDRKLEVNITKQLSNIEKTVHQSNTSKMHNSFIFQLHTVLEKAAENWRKHLI